MRKKNGRSENPDIPLAAPDREGYAFDKIVILRLVLASVLFAVALTGKLSALLSMLAANSQTFRHLAGTR